MSSFNKTRLLRQVDFFTLRLFLSAVEEGQIGRAALRENIAPSAATKRIQELEDVVGLRLLERTPKGVILSPAGEVLVRHIRQIFTNVDELRAELSAFSEGVRERCPSLRRARSLPRIWRTSSARIYGITRWWT